MTASSAFAQLGGRPDSGGPWEPQPDSKDIRVPRGEKPCDNALAEWRAAQTVFGVDVLESRLCEPDDPRLVAAFVRGTDQIPRDVLDDLALAEDAVVKSDDRDGDGDPDVVRITLEVLELNGWHLRDDVLGGEPFYIAPGIAPAFWVFTPKTTIHHSGEAFERLARMPSPVLRVEQGDEVHITVENTHFFPHTIHLHGVDHKFVDEMGEGNDGVPHVSEMPIKPGEARTYSFTAREPGTMFYHCHVQPAVHVLMGLNAPLIIEENRANNTLQTMNIGAGHVRYPSVSSREAFDREYDLAYQSVDKELHEMPQQANDPRVVAERMNRAYRPAERAPEYFLLNGKSFPFTLRESAVVVAPDERVLMRVVNGGTDPVALHTHGHKPLMTHVDGVALSLEGQVRRDVHHLAAAQRFDLVLETTDDGLRNYGEGVWFMHDHREEAVTTNGIGPGGDITVIVYESWLDDETSFPRMNGGPIDVFFTAAYYRGEIPVWHGLGLNGFLGEVANRTAPAPEPPRPTPGPALGGVAALVVAALVAGSRGRWAR